MSRCGLLTLFASCACAGCDISPASKLGTAASAIVITVDSSRKYQRIEGWEAHTQSGQALPGFPAYRDTLFALAANDLGINRVRIAAWSGIENVRDTYADYRSGKLNGSWRCLRFATVNDDARPDHINWDGFHFSQLDEAVQQVVLPLKRQLEARGEKLHVNLLYTAFVNQCPNTPYHHTTPDEYAEFVAATTLHLRDRYNLVPDTWEVILEPDNTTFWRAPQIAAAILAAGERLTALGFAPRFIVPSAARLRVALAYFDELMAVRGVRDYVAEFSYHRYGAARAQDLAAVAELRDRYGIKSAMLEHIGSGYADLHADLKLADVSAWQQFALAYPSGKDNGAQYYIVDTANADRPEVVLSKRARMLRQYFRYIRAGAVRVGAASTDTVIDPLAFINRNGRYVVVGKASQAAALRVQGLPAGRFRIEGATVGGAALDTATVSLLSGQSLTARIAGKGVITIYQDQ